MKSIKKYKEEKKHQDKTDREYIKRKRKELYHVTEEPRYALYYHYPDVEEICRKILPVDARIYEKTMYHHVFLDVRTGVVGVDTSFEVEFKEEEYTQDDDELIYTERDL